MVKIQISAKTEAELNRVIELLRPMMRPDQAVKPKQDKRYIKAWITLKNNGSGRNIG